MGLHQTEKFLHGRRNHQQSEKETPFSGCKYLQVIYLKGSQHSTYIKDFYNSIAKHKELDFKMGRGSAQTFPKEDMLMANRCKKRCSISLIIGKCKSKT